MQLQQSALISNVGNLLGVDINGGVRDDVPLIEDKLTSTELIYGMT
jgi:hypothetical protein